MIAAKIEQPTPAKNRKVAHKRKPAKIARPGQERYAGYTPGEAGSVW
jgi:hypothetical protein